MLLSVGNKKHTVITLPFNVRHEREKMQLAARLILLPERTHIVVTSAFIKALLKAHRHIYFLYVWVDVRV